MLSLLTPFWFTKNDSNPWIFPNTGTSSALGGADLWPPILPQFLMTSRVFAWWRGWRCDHVCGEFNESNYIQAGAIVQDKNRAPLLNSSNTSWKGALGRTNCLNFSLLSFTVDIFITEQASTLMKLSCSICCVMCLNTLYKALLNEMFSLFQILTFTHHLWK